MNTDWIDGIIKMCILNVLIQIIFFRLNDDKNSIVKIIIASIITSIFGVLIKLYLNDNIFMVIISSMLFQIILERIWKIRLPLIIAIVRITMVKVMNYRKLH